MGGIIRAIAKINIKMNLIEDSDNIFKLNNVLFSSFWFKFININKLIMIIINPISKTIGTLRL